MNEWKGPALHRDEPLDMAIWLRQISRLTLDPNGASEESLARLLRRAFHLSRLAPDPLWAVISSHCGEAEFERTLAEGGPDHAAGKLLNSNLELQVSKLDGHFSFVVASPALGASGHCLSPGYAAGILGAWIECIISLVELSNQRAPAVMPGPRISLSAPLPKSTRH